MEPFLYTTWAPDRPDLGGNHLIDALNVIPKDGYYASSPSLVPSSVQDPLSAVCNGAFAYRRYDNNTDIILGTATGLFTTISDGSIVDITRLSGAYTGGPSSFWSFAQGGDTVYATNLTDAVQKYATADADFSNLAGSPPKAQYIAVHAGFLFLGRTETSPLNLRWSSQNNFVSWTPGVDQADTVTLPDGGAITGLIATDALWVFQESAIRRVIPVGPDVGVMQIDKIVDNIGAIPNTIVAWGRIIYFACESGFYMFDGVELTPIGHGLVDNWWKGERNDELLHRMSVTLDPNSKVVIWNYCSSASEVPNSQITYNYATKQWAHRSEQIERLIAFYTFSATLDGFTGVIADTFDFLVDSPAFLGGRQLIGGVTALHLLGTFTGSNLDANVKTAFFRPDEMGRRVGIHSVRIVTDCPTTSVSIYGKENATSAEIQSEAKLKNTVTDRHDLRFSSRWISVNTAMTGVWNKIQGFTDLDWVPLGHQ